MTTETLTRDNLIQGAVTPMTVTVGASQDIARGDLLELLMTPAADTGDGAVTGTEVAVNETTHVATVTEGAADTGTGAITVTAAETFAAPAGAANIFSVYAVAAEAVTTGVGESAVITAYVAGEFNEAAVTFGGESTADDNRFVLAKQGIILKTVVAA